MYLIIIEGTDNIGKDTLKNRLVDIFDVVTVIHCSGPRTKFFKSCEQDKQFINYATDIAEGKFNSSNCVIMNRSHYGEYVYGQIYRKRNPIGIINMINKFDNIIKSNPDIKVKYIQLISSSIELRRKNDDNQSLSEMDIQKMELENSLFLDVYNSSTFDKKLIYVNIGDNFRSKDEIYNEVLNFINE